VATQASSLAEGRSRRILAIVALCAATAAGLVVGLTVFEMRGQTTTVPGAVTTPRPGLPPIQLEFGLRTDPQARALARAQTLLDKEHRAAQASAIFRRYHSVEAQLGLMFTEWRGPSSLPAVKRLVALHPDDPVALLNLGWADYWAGRNADALAAWQKTASRNADSPYGVDAEDALHSRYPIPGLPVIETGLATPRAIARLAPARQLTALKRAAAAGGADAKLVYGTALWNLRMPVSAERQFAAAAKLAPHDPLAQTLAAVGLFSKANPVRAFGHLGPLTAVFRRSPVVEFHLGVLLLWIDERRKAVEHLRSAVADGPQTVYAKTARQLLAGIGNK